MNWTELCADERLRDLPGKIELNKEGQIVMSPTQNRHAYFAAKIVRALGDLMVGGEALVELAIETEDSTKVADVAWASAETFAIIKNESSSSKAPEICVEVQSPGNKNVQLTEKRRLYLQAGAKECWICSPDGQMEFYDSTGLIDHSGLCPEFPRRISD